jgi:hypothetical protein
VQLAPPILIPAGLGIIGSFGAITGIKGVLKNRSQLLKIAASGPLYGAAAAGIVTLIGLGLSAASVGPTVPARLWVPLELCLANDRSNASSEYFKVNTSKVPQDL